VILDEVLNSVSGVCVAQEGHARDHKTGSEVLHLQLVH
jgi:hypothetical protein